MVSPKGRLFKLLTVLCVAAKDKNSQVLLLDSRVVRPKPGETDDGTITEVTIRIRSSKLIRVKDIIEGVFSEFQSKERCTRPAGTSKRGRGVVVSTR